MATAHVAQDKQKDDAQHSGRLLLRLPPALHSELVEAAERACMSLNAYITQVLAESLNPDEAPRAAGGSSRWMRIAVIVDLVMVAVATVAAVVLVIVAWP